MLSKISFIPQSIETAGLLDEFYIFQESSLIFFKFDRVHRGYRDTNELSVARMKLIIHSGVMASYRYFAPQGPSA